MSKVKVAILEKDGVEFGVPTEYELQPDDLLPRDIIIDSEVYIIPTARHHIVMSRMEVNGTIDLVETLGVL